MITTGFLRWASSILFMASLITTSAVGHGRREAFIPYLHGRSFTHHYQCRTPRAITKSTTTTRAGSSITCPPLHHRHLPEPPRTRMVARSSASGAPPTSPRPNSRLSQTLQSLYFPLSVLGAAIVGAMRPKTFASLSEGFVTRSLALIMCLMGCTLTVNDFKRVSQSKKAVLLGWVAQFSIMPSMAYLMSRVYQLPRALAAGVVLVGCCPGGTASNLVTLIAGADVALSVTMTAVSTITAGFMTPFLTSTILGSLVPVDTKALVLTTLKVVLGPVLFGILANTYVLPNTSPKVTNALNRVTPTLSGVLVALICGKVVSQNASASFSAGLPLLMAILSLHGAGFLLGYLASRLLGFPSQTSKTVSIETGAISATCHSLIGSALAWVWSRDGEEKGSS